MSFHLLAQHLHPTALAAKKYFAGHHGATGFREEEVVHAELSLKPTLSARLAHGYILCVEVSEKAYSNSLDTFVVECSTGCFPVRLYVVVPSAKEDTEFAGNLKKAKARGVGVVELSNDKEFVAADAVALSLFGLHKTELKRFPKSKRDAVRTAEQTFLNGNPVNGCQSLYQEIEAVTRAFAKRSRTEGWWRAPHTGEKNPSADLDRGDWAKVLKELGTFLDLKQCRRKCPQMTDGLIGGARALTDPRNLTSHKPTQLKAIIERDKRLRTWFEGARDLLKNWLDATKPLKL
jgi:hypothetical protein